MKGGMAEAGRLLSAGLSPLKTEGPEGAQTLIYLNSSLAGHGTSQFLGGPCQPWPGISPGSNTFLQ